MRLFKVFFDFYLKASIHVALAVSSLAYVGAKSLNISISYPLALGLFSGTLLAYNFIKYGVDAKFYLKVRQKAFIPIQILSLLAAIIGFFTLLKLSSFAIVIIILMGFLTLLYALPLLPNKNNLRNIGGLKIYIVSAVWALATVLLPLSTKYDLSHFVGLSTPYLMSVFSLFLAHFLLVLILMIPFEIRDWKTDQPNLKTIAQRYGLLKVQRLGYLWVAVFIFLQIFNGSSLAWPLVLLLLQILIGFACVMAIFFSSKTSSPYFTYFWVESIPILYALVWRLIS